MTRPSEFDLIAKYLTPLAGEGAFGLRDDAAILKVPEGRELVVTQDALAAGVHFFADDPANLIAQKALRVNLSDLAAKGAVPFAYSLALGLPRQTDEDWIAAFAQGLAEDQTRYAISLTGGDTFSAPGGVTIAVTAFGHVAKGGYRSRLDAKPGDVLFVTGTIGDAALGLKLKLGEISMEDEAHRFHVTNRYLLPQPRVEMAALVSRYASAAMDISDGLVGDAEKLARASNCRGWLEAARVPLSNAAATLVSEHPGLLETALTGGDDYEILLAVSPHNVPALLAEAENLPDLPDPHLTQIGIIEHAKSGLEPSIEPGIEVVDENGNALQFETKSYEHF